MAVHTPNRDELTIEMSRIAQALERIADLGASRMMNRAAEEAATARTSAASAAAEDEHPRQETPAAPRRIAYSMFGR